MFTKSFQSRIEEANKVFVATVEKLSTIQADIVSQITENEKQMKQLSEENDGLVKMKSRTEKQISEIGRLME